MNNFLGKRILRVFPRRTSVTPDDDLAIIKRGPELFDEADEVHVSVAFTWDIPLAEKMAKAWECVAPVKVGGPAYGDIGGEFVPGLYVKSGYLIHHRGCPNKCWFCVERRREMKLLPVTVGWNDLSSNILACPENHFNQVIEAMKAGKERFGKRPIFSGGLEAARIQPWHIDALRVLRPQRMYFANDTPDDLAPLQRAGEMLLDAGWTTASHTLMCYVLCGYPGDTFSAAQERIDQTIASGFMPMAMLYRDKDGNRDIDWMRWQRTWANATIVASKMKNVA